MRRPPESKHPLLPWAILASTAIGGFVGGALAALAGVVFLEIMLTRGRSGSSTGIAMNLRSAEGFIASPMLGTFMLAAGIATAIWATMIAWRTLKARDRV